MPSFMHTYAYVNLTTEQATCCVFTAELSIGLVSTENQPNSVCVHFADSDLSAVCAIRTRSAQLNKQCLKQSDWSTGTAPTGLHFD